MSSTAFIFYLTSGFFGMLTAQVQVNLSQLACRTSTCAEYEQRERALAGPVKVRQLGIA